MVSNCTGKSIETLLLCNRTIRVHVIVAIDCLKIIHLKVLVSNFSYYLGWWMGKYHQTDYYTYSDN